MKEKVAAAMADKYWMDLLIRHESHPMVARLVPEATPPETHHRDSAFRTKPVTGLSGFPDVEGRFFQLSLQLHLRRIDHLVQVPGLSTDRAIAVEGAVEFTLDREGDLATVTLPFVLHS